MYSKPSHLMEMRDQLHAPVALPPGKEPPSTQRRGSWVGHRASQDAVEKIKKSLAPVRN